MRAHPRVGGENTATRPLMASTTGSSPRGRGKRLPILGPGAVARLIPAWAGKTYFLSALPRRAWAHPRVGGENVSLSSARGLSPGSSPRGRGKLGGPPRFPARFRLIPAWAGKTPRP